MGMTHSFFLTSVVLSVSASAYGQATDWKERVSSTIRQGIHQDRIVGTIVGVIKDGETWVQGFGKLSQSDERTPDENTVFEIGSVSKVFTGIALGSLVTSDRVRISDTVGQYIPELVGTPAGTVTLLQLATHTSGFPRLPTNLSPADPLNPYHGYGWSNLLSFLTSFQFLTPGPFPVSYSNTGPGLLGHVLSRVFGGPYEEMVKSLIARPLAMADTGVTLSAGQLLRTAQGHSPLLDERPLWDLSVLAGAGGIRSTMHDMLGFVRANLFPELTLLKNAIQLTHQPQAVDGEDHVGLGWFLSGTGEEKLIWHNGQTGGYHSFVGLMPGAHAGIVVLTNTSAAIPCLSSIVFGYECTSPTDYPLSSDQLDEYAGVYFFSKEFSIEITRRRTYLAVRVVGQEWMRPRATALDHFDLNGAAHLTFQRNETGHVQQLRILENGIEQIGIRQ